MDGARLFASKEDVAAVLAQHHVWPKTKSRDKKGNANMVWRCDCGEEWPVATSPRWQAIEDAHQADMLLSVYTETEKT